MGGLPGRGGRHRRGRWRGAWCAGREGKIEEATQRQLKVLAFEALVARFKAEGVTRVRTLVDRKDHLILSFFRAQGMVAGPSLQLDVDLS